MQPLGRVSRMMYNIRFPLVFVFTSTFLLPMVSLMLYNIGSLYWYTSLYIYIHLYMTFGFPNIEQYKVTSGLSVFIYIFMLTLISLMMYNRWRHLVSVFIWIFIWPLVFLILNHIKWPLVYVFMYIFMWPLVSLILNVQYMVTWGPCTCVYIHLYKTSGFPHALQFMVNSGLLTYLMWPLFSLQWLTSGIYPSCKMT